MNTDIAAHLATRSSYFRGPPVRAASDATRSPFKEWLHFCVLAPEVRLLVNLSLMSRPEKASDAASTDARVIVLSEANGEWIGGLDEIPRSDLDLVPGRVDARFGQTQLRARSGAFELSLVSNAAAPLGAPAAGAGDAAAAAAQDRHRERRRELARDAPAARDRFDHGEGHSVLPAQRAGVPRPQLGSLALGARVLLAMGVRSSDGRRRPMDGGLLSTVRPLTNDRARTRAAAVARPAPVPSLSRRRGGRETGFLRPQSILKIPPAMGLLAPQLSTDVAQQLTVVARAGGDTVRLQIDNRSLAQLIVPNDADLETTVINEVVGDFRLSGQVQGALVESKGESFHEHVTHG